jgi:hypothetical protein
MLIQISYGKHGQDTTASNIDGILLGDASVSPFQPNRVILNKVKVFHT